MGKIIRVVGVLALGLILCSCRESLPGKYSYQQQLAAEIRQTLEVNQSNWVEENQQNTESDELVTPTEVSHLENQPASSPAQWGYKDEQAPEHWGQLSPEYELCGNGTKQSPVDIANAVVEAMPSLGFDYRPSGFSVINTGKMIEVAFEGESLIDIDGTKYSLKKLQFHGPSEHTLDGRYMSMEIQLIHQDEAGNYAIVALFIEPGMDNETLAPVFENLPVKEGDFLQPSDVLIDIGRLLPEDRSYFYVEGSLTTPPCTEGVKWYILKKPIELSVLQIAQLESIYINNHRPTQPLNDRIIKEQEN